MVEKGKRKEVTMDFRMIEARFLSVCRMGISCILGAFVLSFSGCAEADHADEKGLAVSPVYDICPSWSEEIYKVWIFGQQGQLVDVYTYQGSKGLAGSLIQLPEGGYRVVLYAGMDPGICPGCEEEDILADSLCFHIVSEDEASEMYYGNSGTVVVEDGLTMVDVPMNPFWANLTLHVEGLPETVARIEISLRNASRGVYPYTGKIEEVMVPFQVGAAVHENSLWKVTDVPVPPSVGAAVLELVFYSAQNQAIDRSELFLDEFVQGGDYSVVAKYGENGFSLVVVSVEGWESGEGIEGEAQEQGKGENMSSGKES